MSESAKNPNSFAVIRANSGNLSDARLIWADSQFFINFDGAGIGAPPFADGLPSGIPSETERMTIGAEFAMDGKLFGRPAPVAARLVPLGGDVFAISLPCEVKNDPSADDARLAEILDALPVAVAIVEPVDGTILWMNESFRTLAGGGDFDLMGTSLAARFALPGAFKTLMGATGPVTPSASLPTALRTLSGMLTPVIANAKRVAFRHRVAAMVSLTRGL